MFPIWVWVLISAYILIFAAIAAMMTLVKSGEIIKGTTVTMGTKPRSIFNLFAIMFVVIPMVAGLLIFGERNDILKASKIVISLWAVFANCVIFGNFRPEVISNRSLPQSIFYVVLLPALVFIDVSLFRWWFT